MAKHCVVCDLKYPKQCEMCEGSNMLLDYMYQPKIVEAKCRPVEPEPDTRINISSGEDVCLA